VDRHGKDDTPQQESIGVHPERGAELVECPLCGDLFVRPWPPRFRIDYLFACTWCGYHADPGALAHLTTHGPVAVRWTNGKPYSR
jgi:hypothetical protein